MRAYERLLKYVTFDTQSDPESETSPSSFKQFDLLKELKEELAELGINGELSDTGYLYACLKGNCEGDKIGFIAHVDTAQGISGANVKPRIVENWDGKDIKLNEKYSMGIKEFPALEQYIGKSLMVTDGTTLLGADDKAGVAEIMTALEYFINNPEVEHGDIWVAFTPDEEIGRGTANFQLDKFPADYAYTLDGDAVYGLEDECFNAASADITIKGSLIHTGSAKGKLVNSMKIGMEFNDMLPSAMAPEYTEGREGFFHLDAFNGDVETTKLQYIIRNHDRKQFEEMKQMMVDNAAYLNKKYHDVLTLELKDTYYNMKECFAKKMYVIEDAKKAMEECGLHPVSKPIRGGTDGSALTFMGLLTPNLGTGGGNYHGRYEYAVIEDMDVAVEVIKKIVTNATRKKK